MSTVIEFANVSKRFTLHYDRRNSIQERIAGLLRPRAKGETFWALRDVSFSIGAGESLGLVGHNGAGKSTALKLMTRILEPTSGSVALRGRVAALLELGSGFHPDLSGRENVFLNGSLMGFSKRDMQARMDEIVEFAEISEFIDMEVKHYSSGMYTRLAFAVATAIDPDILITDEILAVGDEAFQRKCMERIYRFRQLGKSIVFVSHALETVRQLCDHAVWLDHGLARAVGPAGAVIDAYLEDVNLREAEARRKQAAAQPVALQPSAEIVARGRRHGTREVEIVRIELLDAAGCEQVVFHTHEVLTIRMHYIAHQPVAHPVFGVMLHHESGVWLLGPNNRFGGLDIPLVAGTGYVDYTIVDLPLLAARYQLSVSIYDDALLHAYDAHDRLYQLLVQSHQLSDRFGLLSVAARWAWCEGAERQESETIGQMIEMAPDKMTR